MRRVPSGLHRDRFPQLLHGAIPLAGRVVDEGERVSHVGLHRVNPQGALRGLQCVVHVRCVGGPLVAMPEGFRQSGVPQRKARIGRHRVLQEIDGARHVAFAIRALEQRACF